MNEKIKQFAKKITGVRRMKEKAERDYELFRFVFSRTRIDRRIKSKLSKGQKINVVFVCHRPSVWESQHSVYDALNKDQHFDVIIVAIPNKKELPDLWLNHEVYETEGAEEFWKKYDCINGYNYKTKEWLDLRTLQPDYVFFQQPYNITRCKAYNSAIVSRYAKICYVSYFAPCEYGKQYDDCLPEDFLRDVSLFFSQNKMDDEYVKQRARKANGGLTKVYLTGYPKYDYARENAGISRKTVRNENRFRIIWTPRWTTNEGLCNFFNYKDKLTEYCTLNPDVDFTFRPHPQAFQEWNSTGEFPAEELEKYIRTYDAHINMHLDQSREYYTLIYSSDCLLTDMSSIVFDYLLTGKPIVLCMERKFSNYYTDIAEGLYRVSSWEEASNTLAMLKNGEDPLYETRQKIVTEKLHISKEGAGAKIVNILKKDGYQNFGKKARISLNER